MNQLFGSKLNYRNYWLAGMLPINTSICNPDKPSFSVKDNSSPVITEEELSHCGLAKRLKNKPMHYIMLPGII